MKDLDAAITALEPVNENYEVFIKLVKSISRKKYTKKLSSKTYPGVNT